MKNIFLIGTFLASSFIQAQIVDVKNLDSQSDLPSGSYIKDIDGDFDKFVGTWVWSNNSGHRVTFKLQKVTRYLNPEYNNYSDFIIGDYRHTTDRGRTVIASTENSNPDPKLHPMYSAWPEDNKIEFTFKDVVIQKNECSAIFEFLPGSTTQMKLTLKNNEGPRGVLVPSGGSLDVPQTNPDFTIPNNIILTKQP